ncbi:uncharacterized protein LOC120090620 [Benincasa hispida]|uniref:uncharacterized protein LOC120090620 n=1 Tax=Benincasa hispida TaxID=102211 RepID=UPI0019029667|nr:uncharacterized protein LOC120090620 [Benincasa hispida]
MKAAMSYNPKALDSTAEMVHRAGVDLLRNCDLPPPQKVLRSGMEEKLELLKALRLSQTRAREAERKAAKLMEEKDCISRAFEDEARLMFCYRQSVKLLDLRVSKLQKEEEEEEEEEERDNNGGSEGMKWVWALAICLSVVGVGVLLSYTCNAS